MLYVFTWSSIYEVKEQVRSWKKLFLEKHGDFNLTHIKNLWDVQVDFIAESFLSNSLFQSKKLIIIEIDATERKSTDSEYKQDFILKQLPKVSDDTIILISLCSPDKRSRFYKTLIKEAHSVKTFDEKKSHDLFQEIQKKYGMYISSDALRLLMRYKSEKHQKIVSEIEKLSILYPKIEQEHIKNHIIPELEDSIFTLVDAMLNKDMPLTLRTLKIIAEDTNTYLLYNSLLANLRTTYYILLLKTKKLSPAMIREILNLWKRGFLVDKSYKMTFTEVQNIYKELIIIDRNMKTGMLLWSEEKDFIFEIERIFIKNLQNVKLSIY